MNGTIDFHTHAFPNSIARRAIQSLEQQGGVQAYIDGTIASLLTSMDLAAIQTSVVYSIATKPSQFSSILSWCKQIRSERIIPFPSFHPSDSDPWERIREVSGEGFLGIKFHPYYQGFSIDEERLMPIYEAASSHNVIVVCHTGFDIAFPPVRITDPERVAKICKAFPSLKFVATHLGGWNDWHEVERHLIGMDLYMEISLSLEFLDKALARRLLMNHRADRLIFGSDSPWGNQSAALALLRGLNVGPELERCILGHNARKLLEQRT